MRTITVRVHTKASRKRSEWRGDVLELWICKPPLGGAANMAAIEMVAELLCVPKSAVSIRMGLHSRTKVLAISD